MAESQQDNDAMFHQAKAYLMQCDAEGQSVYDHLHTMVHAMMEENPHDFAHHPERFAEISAWTKKHNFVYGEGIAAASNAPALHHHSQTDRAKENKKLFDKPQPEVITKIEKPTPFTTITTTTVAPKKAPAFRSVAQENAWWKYCGVGLPDLEAFQLDQSITKLALQKNLSEVRFIGKIFGTKGNYLALSSAKYIPDGQTVFEEQNEMPKPPRKKLEVDMQPEPSYKGCNRLSFWVAPHASAEWVLLPDVTPQQINVARKIGKMFTGDLDAKIVSYPPFDGNERNYLRAQLSRIVSSTYISPVGALERVEPPEEEEAEEDAAKKGPKPAKYYPLVKDSKEFAPDEEQGVAAFLDTEQWAHSEGYIYETGRQTKVPPKPETEEDQDKEPEEEEEEVEKKEEEERELFLPVKKDKCFAIIKLPKEPNPEGEEEEEPEPEAEPAEGEDADKDDEPKEEDEEEIADDDPLRKKITAWTTRSVNSLAKKHAVIAVKSLRWPGAVAYASQGGRLWGSVYFGFGVKKTDHSFTPVPAPEIQKECENLIEVMDPTAANEKLVLRGEEPKEADSEDEKEEEDPEEGA